ncbi:MAG: hypothetical protein J7L96_01350, partial [Bacteroidales bacterium]|nr:hypothetical protein [Bacteroidales bacterium]
MKSLKILLSILLPLCFAYSVLGQDQHSKKAIEKLKDKLNILHLTGNTLTDSLESIPYVHIIMKNKNLATASDIHGYFNFPAEVKDTLLFSAIGFKMKTLVVKDTFSLQYPYFEVFLEQDTIHFKELVIRPWQGNYERFKQALLDYQPPETDLDRAYKNLAIMDLYSLLYDSPPTPSMAFRNTMKTYNDNLYWAGQLPPVNITNPLAWAQFFKALKDGV